MQPKYFKSKNQLIDWIRQHLIDHYLGSSNDCQPVRIYLQNSLKKVQDLGNGIAYLLLLNSIEKNCIPFRKIDMKAKNQYDNLSNLKLLDAGFGKLGIRKKPEINKLAKMKYQDNLEMLQWFHKNFQSMKESQINKQQELNRKDKFVKISNQTKLQMSKKIHTTFNQHYKQPHLQSYHNQQQRQNRMKLAVCPVNKKNLLHQSILAHEPNPEQLRKNYALKKQKKESKQTSSNFASALNMRQQLQSNIESQFNCQLIKPTAFDEPKSLIRNHKKEQNQIKQQALCKNTKRQINDDYQNQLKRVTIQMSNNTIIDEIADIVYKSNEQKNQNSQGKLAKIQAILFKNGYGGKKSASTSQNNPYSSQITQHKISSNSLKKQQQCISSEKLIKYDHSQKEQPSKAQQNKQTSFSRRQKSAYEKYVFRQSLLKDTCELPMSTNKKSEQINKKQASILMNTPTNDASILLSMSQHKQNPFSNRRSTLKKQDLFCLDMEQQCMKLFDAGKQNQEANKEQQL